VLLLLAIPFFTALDDSSVWDANEAFYVQTPREMIQRGDWLVPYFNGEPRLNKPPLSYWIVGLLYRLFGVSLFWERLTLAIAAYASVLFLYGIAKALLSDRYALLVAAIFTTTFRFQILAKRLLIDVLMLFCMLAAVWFLVRWLRDRRTGDFLVACLFLGLGFLSKGPVALLPVFLLLMSALFCRRWTVLRTVPWLPGILCFVLVASSWFVALAIRLGPRPVLDFFLQENLGRYGYLTYGPSRGPLYYLGVFVGDSFPWSLLLLASLPWWLSRSRSWPATAARHATVPAWIWLAGYLLFFSFSLNKQEYYILPAYPAAALLLGIHWSERRPGQIAAISTGVLLVAAGVVLYVFGQQIFGSFSLAFVPPLFCALSGVLLIGRRPLPAAILLAGFFASGFGLYLTRFELYKPVAPLAELIKRDANERGIGRDFTAGYFGYTAPSLAFYLDRPILEIYDLEEAVAHLRSNRPVYLLVAEPDYARLTEVVGKPLQIVDRRPKLYTTARIFLEGFKRGGNPNKPSLWTRSIYLITNQPASRNGT